MSCLNSLKIIGDDRGKLVVLESCRDVPFEIKRIFYIFGVNGSAVRGCHAHYKTRQYLVAVSGYCRIKLDNGKVQDDYFLDSPDKGLLQDAMVWGEMYDFSDDCVLLVMADDYYDESDYIKDYNEFLNFVNTL